MSIHVGLTLEILPDKVKNIVTYRLRVSSDASDWDSLRCWLAFGGFVTVLTIFLGNPIATLGLFFGSLTFVGNMVRSDSAGAVQDQPVGSDFKKVAGDDTSTTYEMVAPLPTVPLGTVGDVSIGPDGLLVSGTFGSIIAVDHKAGFMPPPGVLTGEWVGGFSCQKNAWLQEFELPTIVVTDEIVASNEHVGWNAVNVFSTSTVLPADQWRIVAAQWPYAIGSVTIRGNAAAAGHTGRAHIHTSSGIASYDIGQVSQSPPAPDDNALIVHRLNCKNLGRDWSDPRVRVQWLVDPPYFDYGHDPLRQWQLTVSEVPRGARIVVNGLKDGEVTEQLAVVDASDAGMVTIEVVTDAQTELSIDHTLTEAAPNARLTQRWLLPTEVVEYSGRATGLQRDTGQIDLRSAGRLATVSTVAGEVDYPDGSMAPPYSLTLPDGRVAAVHANRLVIAVPFGGAAAHAR